MKGKNMTLDNILEEIKKAKTIAIVVHENPVIIHFCSGRKPWTFESRCPFTAIWLKLYKQLFGKKCRLTHRYKGKTKFLWSIKRILHKLGIKKYEEFEYSKGYREIINKIEIKILGE